MSKSDMYSSRWKRNLCTRRSSICSSTITNINA